MAPERLRAKPYGRSSDVWSAGLVLLECLTGECPWKDQRIVDMFNDMQNFILLFSALMSSKGVFMLLMLPTLLVPDEIKQFLKFIGEPTNIADDAVIVGRKFKEWIEYLDDIYLW